MTGKYASSREQAFAAALAHLQSALDILDEANAPAQIGAHIDLARCQLQDAIASADLGAPELELRASDRARHH